jgi:hypothetical protein
VVLEAEPFTASESRDPKFKPSVETAICMVLTDISKVSLAVLLKFQMEEPDKVKRPPRSKIMSPLFTPDGATHAIEGLPLIPVAL